MPLITSLLFAVACKRCSSTILPVRLSKPVLVAVVQKAAKRLHLSSSSIDIPNMIKIINRESGGNPLAKNSQTKAYGLMQFMPRTWNSVGIKKTNCAVCQVEAGYLYIRHKYQSLPSRAWSRLKQRRSY